MSQVESQQLTEEERSQWVREQFQKANAFLAEQGILTDRVLTKESRYLAPHLAVWKFTVRNTTDKVWAISGDLPTDVLPAQVAETPRDALRYFCYRWQMQAEDIMNSDKRQDPTQQEFARMLVQKAEQFFDLTEQDGAWQDTRNNA